MKTVKQSWYQAGSGQTAISTGAEGHPVDLLSGRLLPFFGAFMIDVGLVGFGFAGRTFHAPVISAVDGLRLAAIVQRRGSEAAQAYPDVNLVRTIDELLAIESIGLVVVATPNPLHFEIARTCLLAGRDVVIDKPFATTYSEAAELVKLASEKRLLLSVYQNRRWDGDFLTVQKLVTEEKLGRIVVFESHFDRFRPQLKDGAWRERAEPGSGVLFDLGPHLIDQALVLFGTPEAASADVRIERDGARIDDAFDVVLHYPKMRAILRAGSLVSTPTPRFVIQGTQGGYLKYGLDPQEDALKRGETPKGEFWGFEAPERWGTLLTAKGDSLVTEASPTAPGDYRQYYQNVRDALLGTAALSVTPEQALRVMRGLELAAESSRRRCAVPWTG
jgi:predicted dehydrogenase